MASGFIRVPAKKLKILHLITGNYDPDAREYNTIVGQVRRVRVIGTIVDKQYFPRADTGDSDSDSSGNMSFDRMVLTLDDGTGLLRVTNWNATEDTYSDILVGQDVEVFGMVRNYKDHPYIIPDIVNVVQDPNYELLRDLEIWQILKKTGDMPQDSAQKSPQLDVKPVSRIVVQPEVISQSMQTKYVEQIEPAKSNTSAEDFKLRDKIYEIILSHDTGSGVPFEEIQEDSQLDTVVLKRILGALEKETAIGETHPGIYQPL